MLETSEHPRADTHDCAYLRDAAATYSAPVRGRDNRRDSASAYLAGRQPNYAEVRATIHLGARQNPFSVYLRVVAVHTGVRSVVVSTSIVHF